MKNPDLYLAHIQEYVEEVWNIVEHDAPGLAAHIQTIRDELARQSQTPPPSA
jgi:hypothetical protein